MDEAPSSDKRLRRPHERVEFSTQDRLCHGRPACGTATLDMRMEDRWLAAASVSSKVGGAQANRVRPSSPPSMHANAHKPLVVSSSRIAPPRPLGGDAARGHPRPRQILRRRGRCRRAAPQLPRESGSPLIPEVRRIQPRCGDRWCEHRAAREVEAIGGDCGRSVGSDTNQHNGADRGRGAGAVDSRVSVRANSFRKYTWK